MLLVFLPAESGPARSNMPARSRESESFHPVAALRRAHAQQSGSLVDVTLGGVKRAQRPTSWRTEGILRFARSGSERPDQPPKGFQISLVW